MQRAAHGTAEIEAEHLAEDGTQAIETRIIASHAAVKPSFAEKVAAAGQAQTGAFWPA